MHRFLHAPGRGMLAVRHYAGGRSLVLSKWNSPVRGLRLLPADRCRKPRRPTRGTGPRCPVPGVVPFGFLPGCSLPALLNLSGLMVGVAAVPGAAGV